MTSLNKPALAPITEHVATAPPTGGKPIINLWWDESIQKMVGEYDDAGAASGTILSDPPVGKLPITNLYFDPITGKMVGEHDDGV